jgi:anaerobic magnesium-protoporphyrin IX monomethyl ester cyclase
MITFVNPKSPFLEDQGVMPPLGIMHLVSALKAKGIDARIVDMGLGDEVPDGDIFITGTTPQATEILKLKRDAYTVVGGPHASIDPSALHNDFSLVVTGEAEEIIEEIVTNKPRGIIHAKRVRALDSLPFPDRSIADRYHYEIGGKNATTMISSRGCNGKCSFCCKAVMDKGIFLRTAENVLAEVREIKLLGYDAAMFYDDTIAINRKRIEAICTGLEKMDFIFRCFVRADQVDEELFNRMSQAGCYEVLIGVESGSQQLLNVINKQETVEQLKNAIFWAKKNGIRVKALMMVGLPGESWETVELSRQFLKETEPDALDVTILTVYKGTDIYKNPDKYNISFRDASWYKGRSDEYFSTVSTPSMSENDIVKARNLLWNTFLGLQRKD